MELLKEELKRGGWVEYVPGKLKASQCHKKKKNERTEKGKLPDKLISKVNIKWVHQ